ncbi:BTB/POZ domain-containing protein At1g04390-like isoform X1 [Coffea arabica]|uniref:BTB/POZ domain-containing protein At1g04390-like isoform X1 n=2 Tax=Coffea arabica TaxID=13443 RepID=A0ABM4UE04_COFAR
MRRSKQAVVGVSSRVSTLHQRLYDALNLGHFVRWGDDKRQKWHCTDIETQKLVLRAIDAFLDCVSSESLSQHPLVKESVDDIVGALGSILELKSESLLKMASDVAAKMVKLLPSSVLQAHVPHLVHHLLSLLSNRQLHVSISCATALNCILYNLSTKREKEVGEILKEGNTVFVLVMNVKDFSVGDKPTAYFHEMALLLSRILWRWPPSRFCVWSDSKFLDVLEIHKLNPESSLKAALLQLYSSLALCGNGAKKLLENRKSLLNLMVESMSSPDTHSVQMDGFRLAQCLMINEGPCQEVVKMCGEHVVKAIVTGMNSSCLSSGKLPKDQMSLAVEACRLALITRWVGNHHSYFWKAGVGRALLGLLLTDFWRIHQSLHGVPLQEQLLILQEALNESSLPSLRPYIWDILGGLVANSAEDFAPVVHEDILELKALIACACLAFTESINMARQISQSKITNTIGSESASRAVLMMVYSPCKYIASQARFILSEVLNLDGKNYIEYLVNTLNATSCRNKVLRPGNFQVVISLISLACYASLPRYGKMVIDHQGMQSLLIFVKCWLSNPVYIKRSNLAPHLHNSYSERVCCHPCVEDWEGKDMQLLFSLWALAGLVHKFASHAGFLKVKLEFDESQIVRELEEICINHSTPGPRWYAAYILSHFGIYGFPNKCGKRIWKAFLDNELADLELILSDQSSLCVNEVILSVRCPNLLPVQGPKLKEKSSTGPFLEQQMETHRGSKVEVRLSAHVDHQALVKLLQYVYMGYLQAGEDVLKNLKILAKHCDLQPLLHMLHRRNPRYGAPIPTFDLTSALGPVGHCSSDVLLEPNTIQLLNWRCSFCSAPNPHFHVHKVILFSSCDYLRALFQSGMQESNSETIKVPVSWNSLIKLVSWLYSDELLKPSFDCLWDNLAVDQRLNELQLYVELCWLAEFWLLEDLHEQCFRVVSSGLETDRYLSVKLIQLAANFAQWKLAEIAATYAAPLYHQLRNSGDLDQLEESFIEMVRAASVQLSKEDINN